ncbi:hypothetical protein GRI91_03345 [Altererythrobacter endophyticus]|uniref:HTH luxR-type domain-containing protein n=1 Tax=Altericroceibacterium endophyticum TaxID=1808508 RepID=A0A6I4T516_9SPHN|nr:hypothetical protein [Altericroceibacterium endophyticum]
MQGFATLYFLGDGIDDLVTELQSGIGLEAIMECVIAIALLAGTILSARYTKQLFEAARRSDAALDVARGAMAELVDARFVQWRLTRSESDVALFAIKGSTISEIAELRGSAEGTVRSQLSQVYAKAGVANQTMLLALFLDELIEPLVKDQGPFSVPNT